MLEGFIKQTIGPGQPQKLLEQAMGCVEQLPKDLKLFSDFHQTKAEIYTWPAWQKSPGQSFANLFPKAPKSLQSLQPSQPLIDLKFEGIRGFKGWLERVFL